VGEAIAKA
jgi:hypothetical protein